MKDYNPKAIWVKIEWDLKFIFQKIEIDWMENNWSRPSGQTTSKGVEGVVTAIIRLPFKPGVAGSSPAWGFSPVAQLVEHRNTTQQHRKSKQLLCPSWSKEWDLRPHAFERAGSSPAGSISLDGSQQLFLIFPGFHPWRAGSIPAVEQTTALAGRKKKQSIQQILRAPHSKYSRNQTFNLTLRSQWYSHSVVGSDVKWHHPQKSPMV